MEKFMIRPKKRQLLNVKNVLNRWTKNCALVRIAFINQFKIIWGGAFGKASWENQNIYLKELYPCYIGIIGKRKSSSTTLNINCGEIIFKSVSDSRGNVSTTLNGATRKVMVTSNASTELNFNPEVAYKRKLNGKVFTKNIACLDKSEFDSRAL